MKAGSSAACGGSNESAGAILYWRRGGRSIRVRFDNNELQSEFEELGRH